MATYTVKWPGHNAILVEASNICDAASKARPYGMGPLSSAVTVTVVDARAQHDVRAHPGIVYLDVRGATEAYEALD